MGGSREPSMAGAYVIRLLGMPKMGLRGGRPRSSHPCHGAHVKMKEGVKALMHILDYFQTGVHDVGNYVCPNPKRGCTPT